MKRVLMVAVFLGLVGHLQAGDVRGHVQDKESGQPLPAVNITVPGSAIGTTSDTNGNFVLSGLPAGGLSLRASLVGYKSQARYIEVSAGDTSRVDFSLQSSVLIGQPVTVTAARGRERETPATFSTLEHETLRDRYTVQDVPVLLSELPSTTFYSESGTGIGYTYLNIRGFDARRIAVMVNGIPQNDPEDHNVYWLDFPDMTASVEDIQVQRGAGSAFYGSPAIGGSVNLDDKSIRPRTLREHLCRPWQLQHPQVFRVVLLRPHRRPVRGAWTSLENTEQRIPGPGLGGFQQLLPRRHPVRFDNDHAAQFLRRTDLRRTGVLRDLQRRRHGPESPSGEPDTTPGGN